MVFNEKEISAEINSFFEREGVNSFLKLLKKLYDIGETEEAERLLKPVFKPLYMLYNCCSRSNCMKAVRDKLLKKGYYESSEFKDAFEDVIPDALREALKFCIEKFDEEEKFTTFFHKNFLQQIEWKMSKKTEKRIKENPVSREKLTYLDQTFENDDGELELHNLIGDKYAAIPDEQLSDFQNLKILEFYWKKLKNKEHQDILKTILTYLLIEKEIMSVKEIKSRKFKFTDDNLIKEFAKTEVLPDRDVFIIATNPEYKLTKHNIGMVRNRFFKEVRENWEF